MTPLRLRMTEDMRVAGLAAGTQTVYMDGVRSLAKHYRRSPGELGEEEVRAYLLGLRERGVALGTFKTHHGGIQFLPRARSDARTAHGGSYSRPVSEFLHHRLGHNLIARRYSYGEARWHAEAAAGNRSRKAPSHGS